MMCYSIIKYPVILILHFFSHSSSEKIDRLQEETCLNPSNPSQVFKYPPRIVNAIFHDGRQ